MQANSYDMDNRKITAVYFKNVPDDLKPYLSLGNNIKDIRYHTPAGEGDAHYVDVYFSDGTANREFNIDHIRFATT